MAKSKYRIVGIQAPGLINVRYAGRFRDIELYNAQDDILAELHSQGIPYVQLSTADYAKSVKQQEIKVKPVKTTKAKS